MFSTLSIRNGKMVQIFTRLNKKLKSQSGVIETSTKYLAFRISL